MSFKHLVIPLSLILLLAACASREERAMAYVDQARANCLAHGIKTEPWLSTCIHDTADIYAYPTESTGLVYPDVVVVVPAY